MNARYPRKIHLSYRVPENDHPFPPPAQEPEGTDRRRITGRSSGHRRGIPDGIFEFGKIPDGIFEFGKKVVCCNFVVNFGKFLYRILDISYPVS